MDLFNKVEKFVKDSFRDAGKSHQIKHFERTVYWVKRLAPGADEALMISAMAHDIERTCRIKEQHKKKIEFGLTHKDFLRPHEEKGAEIIADFLKKEGADQTLIDRVKMLVSRHEKGGNKDQNLLKDADSISFFENNIPYFLSLEKIADVGGKERTKAKIDWMYDRITSEGARKIAKPWYEKAIIDLAKV